MLSLPPEAKDWINEKTRELETLMLKDGISIASVSVSWQERYAALCFRAIMELMQKYGANIHMKEGESVIRIDSGNSFQWNCKENYLVNALILAYETVLEHNPRKKVGHG